MTTFGPKALRRIGAFYQAHADLIDSYRVPTLDFLSGEPTKRRYTRAKVIDMAFFIEGSARAARELRPHNKPLQRSGGRAARSGR